MAAEDSSAGFFWHGLGITQLIAWGCLVATCIVIPRSWQERRSATKSGDTGWAYALKFGGKKSRESLRRKLLTPNPIVWLACRERWQPVVFWAIAVGTAVLAMFVMLRSAYGLFDFTHSLISWLMSVLFYLWMSSQACRFMVEARKSGLMELLLSTPLAAEQVIRGQWRGMIRQFALPLTIYLIAQLASAIFAQVSRNGTIFAMVQNEILGKVLAILSLVAGTGVVVANLIALAWFGMWMGLTTRNTNFATMKTLLFVQILPWMAIHFASTLGLTLMMVTFQFGRSAGMASGFMQYWPILYSLLPMVLTLVKDLVFIMWARRRLYSSFREKAAEAVHSKTIIPKPFPPVSPPRTTPPPLPAQ